MSVYDHVQRQGSLLEECDIQIPGGEATRADDWYPLVMNFSDDAGFSSYIGEPARLTILYSFPSYDLGRGCSRLYDPDSPYYSSFYGAYLVRLESGEAFGFDEDGRPDAARITAVPVFDYQYLVLDDFGLSHQDMVFEYSVTEIEDDAVFAGEDGWTIIHTDLVLNGAAHLNEGFVRPYLQYGSPGFELPEEGAFAPVQMHGILVGKYLPDKDMAIFFYVMAADEQAAQETLDLILSNSVIS